MEIYGFLHSSVTCDANDRAVVVCTQLRNLSTADSRLVIRRYVQGSNSVAPGHAIVPVRPTDGLQTNNLSQRSVLTAAGSFKQRWAALGFIPVKIGAAPTFLIFRMAQAF